MHGMHTFVHGCGLQTCCVAPYNLTARWRKRSPDLNILQAVVPHLKIPGIYFYRL